MGFEPETVDFASDEGDIIDFLEKYFPKESGRMEAGLVIFFRVCNW